MKRNRLDTLAALKADAQRRTKGKAFKNLTSPEKDALLETVCKMLGLVGE